MNLNLAILGSKILVKISRQCPALDGLRQDKDDAVYRNRAM